ncbi:hypothetical protein [Candidatus Phytoplasma luffae]|uniref:hypothetical protein n=1 Tax=Loofah witches'-broom phytoplasma TaxID=35773 RepID=UPI001B39C51B|nr:hypothetical protein [Candidatus Phytoplasma luffae]
MKYFFYFLTLFFYLFTFYYGFKLNALVNYNLDVLTDEELLIVQYKDLDKIITNWVEEPNKQLLLDDIHDLEIIEKSPNFSEFSKEHSKFIPGEKYFFILGYENNLKKDENLKEKYKFEFIYEKKLTKILTQKELGEIENNHRTTIINKIKELNKVLEKKDIKIMVVAYDHALVRVPNYNDIVKVTFELKNKYEKQPLKSILTNTELGEIEDSTEQTIIERIRQLNKVLENKDLQVISSNDGTAKIVSDEYQFSTKVEFTIPDEYKPVSTRSFREPLKNVLTNTQLGEIEDNSNQKIIERIKKLNKVLENKNLQIIASSDENAIIKSNDYENSIKVDFTVKNKSKPLLKDILTNTELGEIENSTEQTIIKQIKKLNKVLEKKELHVFSSNDEKAWIQSDDYLKSVLVRFTSKNPSHQSSPSTTEEKFLKNVLTNTQLGEIEDNSNQKIIERIKKLNKVLENKNLQIIASSDENAIIKSNDYENSIKVDFTVKNKSKPLLKDILTNTELGEIENSTEQTIIKQIRKLNKVLEKKELHVFSSNDEKAWIQSDDYLKSVLVRFTSKNPSHQSSPSTTEEKFLKNVLTNTQLGEIEDNSNQKIIERIKKLNKVLENKNLQIIASSDENAIIKSNDYENSIKVDFTVKNKSKPLLKDILTNTELGEIENSTEQTIIKQIKKLNKVLEKKELHVFSSNDEKAWIQSDDYLKSVLVRFTSKNPSHQSSPSTTEEKFLKNVLTNTQLGEIEDNSNQKIIERIKKLNKVLENKNLQIIASSDENAIIKSNDYENSIKVDFTVKNKSKPLLKDILTNTELGEIENSTEQTIIKQIRKLNKVLEKKELHVFSSNDEKAWIQSDDYLKSVLVRFTSKNPSHQSSPSTTEEKFLKNVLTNTQLGEIEDNSNQKIIERIKKLNKVLENKNLQIIASSDENAIIKSNDYENSIKVDFTVKNKSKPLLKDILTNTELGEIENSTEQTIIKQIKKLNKVLEKKELHVFSSNDEKAWIQSDDYLKSVLVRFTSKNPSHQSSPSTTEEKFLKNVLTNTQLGEIEDDSHKTIIKKIKQLNPNLNSEEFQVEIIPKKNKAIIKSNKFVDEIEVVYNLPKEEKEEKTSTIIKIIIIVLILLLIITLLLK